MGYSNVMKWTNKYDDNGNLVKKVYKGKSAGTTTYTYQEVRVPKSLVKKVKAQQWAIVNDNLNFALGVS